MPPRCMVFNCRVNSTTTGTIGNQSFYATTQGTQIVPSSIPYTVKRIHLFLFKIDKINKKGDLVWEGYFGAGSENFSSYTLTMVSQIIKVVGRNFEGKIPMKSEGIPPSVNPATGSIFQTPKLVQLEEEVRTLQEQNRSLQKQLDQSKDSQLIQNSVGILIQNINTLEKECEKENYQACAEVGFYYENGKGGHINLELAASYYKRGCDGNNAQACTGLGMLYKNGRGVEENKNRAKVLLTKGCNQGLIDICLELGSWLQDGEFGEKDESQAATVFQKACDGGNLTGCTQLAWKYLNGKVVPKDEKRGIELFNQGCDGGYLPACGILAAVVYASGGAGIQKNTEKAISLFQKGCDGGLSLSCVALARYYTQGEGVDKNIPKSLELLEKACEAGDPNGCVNIADLFMGGVNLPKNLDKATHFYRKACESQGSASWISEGCTKLGSLYEGGNGIPKNLEEARALYKKACEGGNNTACGKLGVLTEKATGKSLITSGSAELLRKGCQHALGGGALLSALGGSAEYSEVNDSSCQKLASYLIESCEQGDTPACIEVSDRYANGMVPKDKETGVISIDKKLCEAGHADSCIRLDSREIPKDQFVRENILIKHCQKGHFPSCDRIQQYAFTHINPLNPSEPVILERGAELSKHACEGGIIPACIQLGDLYEEGQGVEQDFSYARELYQEACHKNDPDGCYRLAYTYQMGIGVPKGSLKATIIYRQSADLRRNGCEKGKNEKVFDRHDFHWDCFFLADLYKEGLGVPKDLDEATALYKQACDGGNGPKKACNLALTSYEQECEKEESSSCLVLGRWYRQGYLFPKDILRAINFYEKACSGKEGDACYSLGTLYKHGKGDLHKPELGKSYFEKACQYGSNLACFQSQ